MTQGKVDCVERYYESLESWDMEFGKVYSIHSRRLSMIGADSWLWAGLLAKSELRQLLDELFEHALDGGSSSWEQSQVSEGAFSQR
jgi:hypothetical protein